MKHKNTVVILLALAFLLLGGALPAITAAIQDITLENKEATCTLETMELILDEPRSEVSDTDKIGILASGLGITLNENEAKMSDGQVLEAIFAELQPYADVGLIPVDLTNDLLDYYPVLCYGEKNAAYHTIAWYVTMSFDGQENDRLHMYLDDDTGRILWLEYWCEEPYLVEGKLPLYVEMLYGIYFSSLPVDAPGIEQAEMSSQYMDSKYCTVSVDLKGTYYDKVSVEFGVTANSIAILLNI